MKSGQKYILNGLLIGFVVLSLGYAFMNREAGDSASEPKPLGQTLPVVDGVDPDFAVYFFYNDVYCDTCEKLEGYALEAVQVNFADELVAGILQWRSLDMTTVENEHYADDFGLYSKSIVLVKLDGESEIRWENLEDIWDLVYDKEAYGVYIETSLRSFMDGTP